MDYRILPPEEILETNIELPLSKSMAARTLLIDFIAGGADQLSNENMPHCEDVDVLRSILAKGLPLADETIDAASSGTALRLLIALYAASNDCHCIITGTDSLRHRPIAPLVDCLRELGADIKYTVREGYAPVEIHGRKLDGGIVKLDPSLSSQYATALMLVAPLMTNGLRIEYTYPTVSAPYVQLTAKMMNKRGVEALADAEGAYIPATSTYNTSKQACEPDWSAAAFWYEIAALTAGWVTLPALCDKSAQPDRATAEIFERLGVITEFTDEGAELSASPEIFSRLEADLSNNPDLAPALAATACLIGVPFRLTGVAALRHKESDRLDALCNELSKIGCVLNIENYDNDLVWDGKRIPIQELPVFNSYNDHRLAMALAPAAIFIPGTIIRGAECVSKSYPEYWEHLRTAGFTLLDPSEPLPTQEQ